VRVTELVPPAVATEAQGGMNPAALPLDDYLDEVLQLITAPNAPNEIIVDAAQRLRWAERDGTYTDLLSQRSEALKMLPGR
jgi:short-subunit dehydrogenase involved in D-alanine esterification of teichoic acids